MDIESASGQAAETRGRFFTPGGIEVPAVTAEQMREVEPIQWANGTGTPILALDGPSGVDATTGHRHGVYIQPHWTMTLALPQTGLLPQRTGRLFLADIGIPQGGTTVWDWPTSIHLESVFGFP